jgi:hypothetical protein
MTLYFPGISGKERKDVSGSFKCLGEENLQSIQVQKAPQVTAETSPRFLPAL